MRITDIEISHERVALAHPFVTALRRVENVEFVRVFVRCSHGFVGIGEAPATVAITGEDIDSITNAIAELKEHLIGLDKESALQKVHQSTIGSSAKAALDMALIHLETQQKGITFAEYFGIKDYTPLQTDITISLGDERGMLEAAKDACLASMDILKVKLGSDISHAIRVTQSISQELPNATLLIDANQAWSKESTLRYIEGICGCAIELIEQPLRADDVAALKEITNASDIAILADEAVFTLEDAKEIVQTQSADMINIKLMKCGGLSRAVEILEYAREQGVVCMLGSMLEGPYSINVALYLAFAYRDVIKYVDLDSPLLYKEPTGLLDFVYDGATISLR